MTIRQRRGPRRAGVGAGEPVVDIPTHAWQLSAWCGVPTGVDLDTARDMFDAFDEPTRGTKDDPDGNKRLTMLRALCSGCEVRAECLAFALASDGPEYGFLAGMTPEERQARRRGDSRSHEELVAAGARVGGGRVSAQRPPAAHGGPRRGVAWTEQTEVAAIAAGKETG